jgi:hypothetical protein
LGENIYRQQIAHLRRFGHDLPGKIDNADPVNGRLAHPPVLYFAINGRDSVWLFQLGPNGAEFVGEDGVVFFERVTDDDPIENAEPAGEEERGAKREKENELRRNGTRLSSV